MVMLGRCFPGKGEDQYGVTNASPPSTQYAQAHRGFGVQPHTGDEEQSHDTSSHSPSRPHSSRPHRQKPTGAATLVPVRSVSPCTNAPRATSLPASRGLLFTGACHTSSCEQSRGASLVLAGGRSMVSARQVSCSSFAELSIPRRTTADGSSVQSGTRLQERGLYGTGVHHLGMHLGRAGDDS